MQFITTSLPEVYIIEPTVFPDARGYFMESYKQVEFEQHCGKVQFVQDNESQSTYGVLRGLHLQRGEWAQAKLVRVIQGTVLDVAVDVRVGSPTFGKHVAVTLSAENKRQLFIPRHFAHGFVVLSPQAIFTYKVDNVYAPQAECSIRFDDPAIGIDWQVPVDKMVLSDKDKRSITLAEWAKTKDCA
ncbi:dTDP-4-dehydrorhamnose 3,5-epimerase [Bacteroidia bacterium]|nr:dTDP-4-dehydrorhamnose 3,5-epimerase [Bacteroidia bacterium]GHT81032.1 dTDP-4-dehydrorhamnose 3,5-epimerase [Bacteroidia bacterium]